MVVAAYRESVRFEERKQNFEQLRSLFDLWIRIEHPQVWDEIEASRRDNDDEVKLDSLSADTMDEMITKMRRMAGML